MDRPSWYNFKLTHLYSYVVIYITYGAGSKFVVANSAMFSAVLNNKSSALFCTYIASPPATDDQFAVKSISGWRLLPQRRAALKGYWFSLASFKHVISITSMPYTEIYVFKMKNTLRPLSQPGIGYIRSMFHTAITTLTSAASATVTSAVPMYLTTTHDQSKTYWQFFSSDCLCE